MRSLSLIVGLLLISAPAHADEGMWPLDALPIARIEQATGVKLDRTWLDRAQAGAVRLANGCSASIVSREGLVATNHHCVRSCLQQLSSSARDYLAAGFMPAGREEEITCPGLQAEVLLGIVDITPAIEAAMRGKSGAAQVRERDRAMAAAESAQCGQDATLRCQTLSFHGDSQFKVYRYRKYIDVRIAFAPEAAIAAFGGDPDNFNFPRYTFDASFLRLYENGRAADTPGRLRWNAGPVRDGEPTFVIGNPGSTNRAMPHAELETLRDLVMPFNQTQLSELRGRLIQFADRGGEAARVAGEPLFWLENSYKSADGGWRALRNPDFMAAKAREEAQLRTRLARDPTLAAKFGDPWADLAKVQGEYAALYPAYRLLEQRAGGNSQLFSYARTLVRGGQERAKPEAQRWAAFAESRLGKIERDLAADVPVDRDLERLYFEFWLLKVREALTVDHPQARALLAGQSPQALATALAQSKLSDPAVRLALWRGGQAAVRASDDPLIRFVLRTNAASETLRDQWWERITAPSAATAGAITRARYAVYGDEAYPDATFSLRLSFGRVAGWREHGADVPFATAMRGLFDRATGAEPFALPASWLEARSRMAPDTVMNFVTTNDIVGGSSGSPVLNAEGEVIGLAFDGNIHSLGGTYGYDGDLNRTVAVSAAAINEALIKVYRQERLVRELAQP